MRLDSIALAAVALAAGGAPVMHVDADGDGFPDSVALEHGQLHVATRTGLLTATVPPRAVLDGDLHRPELLGELRARLGRGVRHEANPMPVVAQPLDRGGSSCDRRA